MIFNYIRSAHHSVIRNKLQSLIQVFSLSIGLTVFALVLLYLYDELTVDKGNPNFDQVYRVEAPDIPWGGQDVVPLIMGPHLESKVPEIQHMTRLRYNHSVPIAIPDKEGLSAKHIKLRGAIIVDSGFFHVFPQDFIFGDPELNRLEPFQIVLTQTISTRLFGSANPVGNTVYIWNTIPYEVKGVIRDPLNTHLKFEAIYPIENMFIAMRWNGKSTEYQDLLWLAHPCYVSLHKEVDVKVTEQKMKEVWQQQLFQLLSPEDTLISTVKLRPLSEVHYADIDPTLGYMTHVDRKNLLSFFFLGLGILLLAIINYVNLSTARASMRSREIALRKISGSSRSSLVFYLLSESIITTFFSFLIAMTLVQLLFPSFNYLMQADINLYFLGSPIAWILTLMAILLVGILAGLYPALKMSGESPLSIFSGGSQQRGSGLFIRRILMVLQFSSAVVLLFVIFSMRQQIRFMKTQDLGFDSEQLVHLGTGSLNRESKLEILSRIKDLPEVEYACLAQPVPGQNQTDDVKVVDDPESLFYGMELKIIRADLDFFKVYDLKFTQGEEILNYSSLTYFNQDTIEPVKENLFVINETARKALGVSDPVGVTTSGLGPGGRIVGVVEDFHFQSLKFPVKPVAIWLQTDGTPWSISIKLNSQDLSETLRKIENTFRQKGRVVPVSVPQSLHRYPLEISFIDETFNQQYEQVERLQAASSWLSIMALLIASLGLFGLSTFMAQRRIKEIGIRRALGASEELVIVLLAKDFLKWVTVSVLLGLPLGYLVVKQWQGQFAFQVNIGVWIFVFTILVVYVVSLGTVAWHSIKASRANPVDSLRTE